MSLSGKGSLLQGIDEGAPASATKSKGGGSSAGGGGTQARNNKLIGLAAVIGIVALCVFIVTNFLGGTDAATASNTRVMIDAETGELFEKFRVPESGSFPYENKKTGKKTLYPAEPCFWTKDGKAKLKPTWVLLNQHAGKPGPTTCPDCGRPVTPHNKPPPGELFPQN